MCRKYHFTASVHGEPILTQFSRDLLQRLQETTLEYRVSDLERNPMTKSTNLLTLLTLKMYIIQDVLTGTLLAVERTTSLLHSDR
jgi:hypothetical protein